MARDNIALLKKLQTLAERGEPHEKESARKMLDKIKKKYDIKFEEIEEENNVEFCMFEYKNKLEKRILNQVIFMITGELETYRIGKKRTVLGLYCTKSEELEINITFEFYERLFMEDLDLFVTAFCNKHHIFPSDANNKMKKLTDGEDKSQDIDMDRMMRLQNMINGMQDKRFQGINKMIESED